MGAVPESPGWRPVGPHEIVSATVRRTNLEGRPDDRDGSDRQLQAVARDNPAFEEICWRPHHAAPEKKKEKAFTSSASAPAAPQLSPKYVCSASAGP